jgi:hypothetical protein
VIQVLCATTTSPTASRTARSGAAGVADRTMVISADIDHQRLGINRAAASLGLRLPDDVSVVGLGDLSFGGWVTPRLTTVLTPLADMTVRAACMAPLLLLSGRQPKTAQVEITVELVVREQRASAGDRASRRTQSGGRGSAQPRKGASRGHGVADGPAPRAVTWHSSAAQHTMMAGSWYRSDRGRGRPPSRPRC